MAYYTAVNDPIELSIYMDGGEKLWEDGNIFSYYNYTLGRMYMFLRYSGDGKIYKMGELSTDSFNKKYAGSFENWRNALKEKDMKKLNKIMTNVQLAMKDADFIENLWK